MKIGRLNNKMELNYDSHVKITSKLSTFQPVNSLLRYCKTLETFFVLKVSALHLQHENEDSRTGK
jgi:hypothetical protein